MRLLNLEAALSLSAICGLHAQTSSPGASDQWRLVDGARNPELIPDVEAWKILFRRLSDSPAGMSRNARLGYMAESGLTEKELSREGYQKLTDFVNTRVKSTSLSSIKVK